MNESVEEYERRLAPASDAEIIAMYMAAPRAQVRDAVIQALTGNERRA